MKRGIGLVLSLYALPLIGATNHIQIGDYYSKIPYKNVYYSTTNQHVQSLIENTVLINGKRESGVNRGTGFYIGEHKGRHLFLTNAHVMNTEECDGATISFLKHNMEIGKAKCEQVLLEMFKSRRSDMTLFSVKGESLLSFKGQGLELDLNYSPKAGQLLATHGFGIKSMSNLTRSNNDGKLKKFNPNVSMDSDCTIVSKDNLLADFNDYKVDSSFATGCDLTSGDSGSAVIDRENGKVVGLFWGSGENQRWRYRIRSKDLWEKVIGSNDYRIWKHMSYAISMKALSKHLAPFLGK